MIPQKIALSSYGEFGSSFCSLWETWSFLADLRQLSMHYLSNQ